jgi:hypothetical protein
VRIYVLSFLIAAGAALLAASHWAAYDYGRKFERDAMNRAVARHQAREAELIGELAAERKKVKVEYRERIKIVKQVADPANCIDRSLPPELLQSLSKEHP